MIQKQLFEIPSSRTGMFFGDKFPNVPYNFLVGHAEPCSFHQRREGVVWCGRAGERSCRIGYQALDAGNR